MISRTWLFRPSARALFIFSRMAARMPSRNLRMVLAALMNGARRERLALEHQRSMSSTVSSGVRSPERISGEGLFEAVGAPEFTAAAAELAQGGGLVVGEVLGSFEQAPACAFELLRRVLVG